MNLKLLKDLLVVFFAAKLGEKEIELEHIAIHYYGHISVLSNELIDHQKFNRHSPNLQAFMFLSRGNLRIELIPPNIPEHQGWRLLTEEDFASLRGAFMLDPNFEHLTRHSVRSDSFMASMFQHVSTKTCVQIVYRTEGDLFPNQG